LAHPVLEHVARDPDVGDLEDRGPDPPLLADQRLVDVDAEGGEVLAELPVADLMPEPLDPDVDVLTRERVDRLVGAAVVLLVGHVVALDAERVDLDGTVDLVLVDGGPTEVTGP